jgi:transposase-like protein
MNVPKTLQQAIQYFADYENCRQFMIAVRWEDGVVRCPYCNSSKVTWLAKARVYRCYGDHLRKKFSLKVGTVFEDSPIGLEKWLPAVWLLSNCRNGISSYEISRSIGVTQKSAWFMLHRIRLAMESQSFVKMGNPFTPVEIDETFIGGKPQNMHMKKRLQMQSGLHANKKMSVMGMLDRESRQVRAKVVPNVKRAVLQGEILRQIHPGSKIFTDGWTGYDSLKAQEYIHETVTHLNEYVRGQVHTQGIENFWSLLKRGLKGTYVAVEPFHLNRYVGEQVFRYNNRLNKDDYDRFAQAVSQIVGKRLTYAEVTGKVGETAGWEC